jgi:hypothetical protein
MSWPGEQKVATYTQVMEGNQKKYYAIKEQPAWSETLVSFALLVDDPEYLSEKMTQSKHEMKILQKNMKWKLMNNMSEASSTWDWSEVPFCEFTQCT